jgi:putative addiction module component (TIGR02574 family)
MPSTLPIPPGFDDLSVEKKLDYVQSLWDRIAAQPDDVAVPEWHEQVIAERLAAHRANPEQARPSDEVHSEIQLDCKFWRDRLG